MVWHFLMARIVDFYLKNWTLTTFINFLSLPHFPPFVGSSQNLHFDLSICFSSRYQNVTVSCHIICHFLDFGDIFNLFISFYFISVWMSKKLWMTLFCHALLVQIISIKMMYEYDSYNSIQFNLINLLFSDNAWFINAYLPPSVFLSLFAIISHFSHFSAVFNKTIVFNSLI